MKVKVSLKSQSKIDVDTTFELVVSPTDTVLSVKERIADIEPTPFPEKKLIFGNTVLADGLRLADCGVKEGDSLDFVVSASEAALVQQLSELLQSRAVSVDELALLYCHKHGVTIPQTLSALGQDEQLERFLKGQKPFIIDDGRVMLVHEGKVQQPKVFDIYDAEASPAELSTNFKVSIVVRLKTSSKIDEERVSDLIFNTADTVLSVKERIAASELIPFPDQDLIFGGKTLDDEQKLSGCGVKDGDSLEFVARASEEAFVQQLTELLQNRALSSNDLSLLYNCRHGVPVNQALKALGRREKFRDFLKRQTCFALENGCVSLMHETKENRRYMDLHDTFFDDAFTAKVTQTFNDLVDAIVLMTFFNIHHVARGRSVAKGTAIEGAAGAEVVFFLNGLPLDGQERWLPGLLKSAVVSIQECLCTRSDIEGIHIVGDAVQVRTEDMLTLNLRFSPVFESHDQVIMALGEQNGGVGPFCAD